MKTDPDSMVNLALPLLAPNDENDECVNRNGGLRQFIIDVNIKDLPNREEKVNLSYMIVLIDGSADLAGLI